LGTEGIGSGHPHAQTVLFLGAEAGEFDLGPQGLTERRLHVEPTKTERMRLSRCEAGDRQSGL
jgi:hypothetical protein